MARYLVIEFEDNESADKLMAKINDARAGGALYRVVGLFVKPRRFCTCPDGPASLGGASYRKPMAKNGWRGVDRGLKFGWWVCSSCNRPPMRAHQLVNQLIGDQLYKGFDEGNYEYCVDGLSIGPIHKRNITRLKLKKKGKKHGRKASSAGV